MIAVEQAEKEPSMHDLLDGWLSRMPFLQMDDFVWTNYFADAVAAMIRCVSVVLFVWSRAAHPVVCGLESSARAQTPARRV